MPYTASRDFASTPAALSEVMDFIIASCRHAALARDDCLRLSLLAEELFTNSLHHGYGGCSEGRVSIALDICGDRARLDYADGAPPFDPLASPSEVRAGSAETRPVGGLGLALVKALGKDLRYEQRDGRNCLSLVLLLSLSEGSAPD